MRACAGIEGGGSPRAVTAFAVSGPSTPHLTFGIGAAGGPRAASRTSRPARGAHGDGREPAGAEIGEDRRIQLGRGQRSLLVDDGGDELDAERTNLLQRLGRRVGAVRPEDALEGRSGRLAQKVNDSSRSGNLRDDDRRCDFPAVVRRRAGRARSGASRTQPSKRPPGAPRLQLLKQIPSPRAHRHHLREGSANEREQVVDRLLRGDHERRAARIERERFGDALGTRRDDVGVKNGHITRQGVFGARAARPQEEDPAAHPGVRSRDASMSRAAPRARRRSARARPRGRRRRRSRRGRFLRRGRGGRRNERFAQLVFEALSPVERQNAAHEPQRAVPFFPFEESAGADRRPAAAPQKMQQVPFGLGRVTRLQVVHPLQAPRSSRRRPPGS